MRSPLLIAALLLPCTALAQPLRTAVVPAGSEVVIPPRGQAPAFVMPAKPRAAAAIGSSTAGWPRPIAEPAVLLPLAAAALLGVGLPGGGGGASSAPATTR